jgi:hypothetical protein
MYCPPAKYLRGRLLAQVPKRIALVALLTDAVVNHKRDDECVTFTRDADNLAVASNSIDICLSLEPIEAPPLIPAGWETPMHRQRSSHCPDHVDTDPRGPTQFSTFKPGMARRSLSLETTTQ